MKSPGRVWKILLTSSAQADLVGILRWSQQTFGHAQAATYADTLSAAIAALVDGPLVSGVRRRDDIRPGLMTLHVARKGRKGRHFVAFRLGEGDVIQVLRLLHDAMDLAEHLRTPADN